MSTRTRVAPHAADRASENPTPAQLKDLFAQIETGSPNVNKERMQMFLRGKLVDPAQMVGTQPVAVPETSNLLLDQLSEAFHVAIPEFANQAIELVKPFCDPDLDLELKSFKPLDSGSHLPKDEVPTYTFCHGLTKGIGYFHDFDVRIIVVGHGTDGWREYSDREVCIAPSTQEALNDALRSAAKFRGLIYMNEDLFGDMVRVFQQTYPRLVKGIFEPLPPYGRGLSAALDRRLRSTSVQKYRLFDHEVWESIGYHIVDLLRTAILMMVVGHDEHLVSIKAMLKAQTSGHPFIIADRDKRLAYFLSAPR